MPMNRGQAFLTEGVFGLALITALLVGGYGIGLGLCNAIGNGYFALGSLDADLVGLPLLFLACIIAFLSSTFAVSVSNSGFQAVVMIILVIIMAEYVFIRMYTGLRARYEGTGKKAGKGYLVWCVWLILESAFSIIIVVPDIIDMNGDFIDTYLSVFMELTSLAMTVEVFLAGISVKRYRKKLKEGKLSAG